MSEQVQRLSEAFSGRYNHSCAQPGPCILLEGQRALEEIDRLEKATVSHLSFVFPIRGLQCCRVAGDNIIKHERLPSLWAFMARVSISTVFHGWVNCPLGLQRCLGEAFLHPGSRECKMWCKAEGFGKQREAECLSVIVQAFEGPSRVTAVENAPGGMGEGVGGITGCLQISNTVNPSSVSSLTRWTCKISPPKWVVVTAA